MGGCGLVSSPFWRRLILAPNLPRADAGEEPAVWRPPIDHSVSKTSMVCELPELCTQ